jgi:hypothetical protein
MLIATALIALLLAPPNTWTVDDNGPADFAQISEAIARVGAGDVLLVEPGQYARFDLSKRLTILGRAGGPRPHVNGISAIAASSFTLAGLDLDGLRVQESSGRARIDDCRIGTVVDVKQQYALVLDGCSNVVVSRSQVVGSHNFSQQSPGFGGVAMYIRTCNAMLVDCKITGAKGFDGPLYSVGGSGGTGLIVADSSRTTIVGSKIVGGYEGWGNNGLSTFCFDGPSGTGLQVVGSLAVVRGSPTHPDAIDAGGVDPICTATKGPSLHITEGTVIVSGVYFDHDNVLLNGGTLVEPAVAEPFILIDGTDAPGGHRRVRLYGPAGAPCLLAISVAPGFASLGGFDDKLWLDLSGFHLLLPLVTSGQSTPVDLEWAVPASTAGLEGVTIELQPFFPGLPSTLEPGKSLAGNVAELVVRF